MTQNAIHEWYRARFDTFEKGLNGDAGTAIHALRRRALASFGRIGFPTPDQEEWRFTNVGPLARTEFQAGSLPQGVESLSLDPYLLRGVRAIRLVFVNGHYVPTLSDIPPLRKGVLAGNLADALKNAASGAEEHLGRLVSHEEDGFTALNTTFLRDGAFVRVPDGVALEEPVHFLFLSTRAGSPFLAGPRNLVLAGDRSELSIVETYAGPAGAVYLTNAVTEIVVGEGAVLEHDKFQFESTSAFHVGSTAVRQLAASRVTSNSIALGGAIVRNTVRVTLDAEGCESTLNGLSVATGDQLIDNHTTIDHAKPNCSSHELYKAILDGRARGVFNGKIFVRTDAQKTDAKQTNRTLLLSDEATIDTKPQLEIFADDVKCTHGATVGQLDEDQVFYLRSRGIAEVAARDILTFAFAGDVIHRVHVESLRSQLESLVHAQLRDGRVARDGIL